MIRFHPKEQIVDQPTSNVPSQIENIVVQQTDTIDLCTPPPIILRSEIEMVDLTTPSTIDLSTPQTIDLSTPPSITIDQNTPNDATKNNTDESPLSLSPI